MRVHPFELLGSTERKWGVAGVWKIDPVELQERARLHFPYTSSTYYHVESVLQKRLKRQDHPLLIVSISIYNKIIMGGEFDPGFVEIDQELIFTVILLPSDDSFNKGCCHMRTK